MSIVYSYGAAACCEALAAGQGAGLGNKLGVRFTF